MSTRSAADNRQRRWAKQAERRREHTDKYQHPADRELAEKLAALVAKFNGEEADNE